MATNCCIVASLLVKQLQCSASIKRTAMTAMYRRTQANGLQSRPRSFIANCNNMNKNQKQQRANARKNDGVAFNVARPSHKGCRPVFVQRDIAQKHVLSGRKPGKVAAHPASPNGDLPYTLLDQVKFFNNVAPLPLV